MSDWSSKQYLKFKDERTQPAFDLANRIALESPLKILDIGCGPGNSTMVLKDKFPNAYILGVDSSKDMIDSAKKSYDNIDFKLLDVSSELNKLDKDFDVVFSNACFQWIPNNNKLLTEVMNLLKPNGFLTVQIPFNYNEPIHQIIIKVSQSKKWKNKIHTKQSLNCLEIDEYYDILSSITKDFKIWITTYIHKLNSHEDILEWYRGTGLRPYLNQLEPSDVCEFEQDVMNDLKSEYSVQIDGNILFNFPRLFFTAIK